MNLAKKTNLSIEPLILLILLAGVALFSSCSKSKDYPIEPDTLGSGNTKWSESITPDGWTSVSNEEGSYNFV